MSVLAFSTFALVYLVVKSSSQFHECLDQNDCLATNSECRNNICQCPDGQIESTDGSHCLPLNLNIQSECKDDNQCIPLLGKSRCYKGKCDCEIGWNYYKGRCIKSSNLNEPCTKHEDCFNGYDLLATICTGECVCNKGYYLRGNYDCRPAAEKLGDYCSLQQDCKVKDAICRGSFCVLSDSTSIKNISNIPKVIELNLSNKMVHNEPCENNRDCDGLENSICHPLSKTCICKREYFYNLKEKKCVAELGIDVSCKNDKDCLIPFSRCVSGRCYCRETYFTLKGNNQCQKPMTQDHLFCNNVERCYVMGTNVACQDNECTCSSNAELDDDFVCRIKKDASAQCENDDDCDKVITNSICSAGACACPKNYRKEKNVCLPNIGALCDNNKKLCQIAHSNCDADSKRCKCDDNFVDDESTRCIKIATNLEEECEIEEQCSQGISNSECTESMCKCKKDYITMNNQCYLTKEMGDSCDSIKDCRVSLGANVFCRNGYCQCLPNVKETKDGRDCELPSSGVDIFVDHTRSRLIIFVLGLLIAGRTLSS